MLIDPDVLKTLPEREYRAGLYEIVKCGVIRDAELFDVLDRCAESVLRQEPDVLDRIIADAVRIKAEVVTADEREGDLRRILNFGHTFGHALEAETKYERLLHGEAVAWGMQAATLLAERTGHLPAADASAIQTGRSQIRADPAARRDLRREPGRAPPQRQEDRAGASPLRAAGQDRRDADRVGRR